MGTIVQKLNLTRKKTFYASERDTPRVKKLREEIWHLLQQINLENLVFVDETGVNLAMSRLYARALKGKRAVGDRPARYAQLVSALRLLCSIQLRTAIYGTILPIYLIWNDIGKDFGYPSSSGG